MKAIISVVSCRRRKICAAALFWSAVVSCLLSGCASRSQFEKGYERGASDTVKRQYWMLQNIQKREAANQSRPRLSLYPMPIVPDPNATVKTVPYEITIPIYE